MNELQRGVRANWAMWPLVKSVPSSLYREADHPQNTDPEGAGIAAGMSVLGCERVGLETFTIINRGPRPLALLPQAACRSP